MKTRLTLLGLGIMIMGCSTVSDIRGKEAARFLDSNNSPKQIVQCVMNKAPAEVTSLGSYYHFSLSEGDHGSYHILVSIPAMPVGEASFSPNDNGGSHVELRSGWNFWDKGLFWDCIVKCASPQNNPGK